MAKGETKTESGAGGGAGPAASLGPNSEIGRKLKQYYDELLAEDVPERFTNLLRELEKSERGASEKKDRA